LTNVIAISANTTTCLALKVDGTIIEWGSGPKTPAGLSNVVAIAAGPAPGAALKIRRDGRLVGNHGGKLEQFSVQRLECHCDGHFVTIWNPVFGRRGW